MLQRIGIIDQANIDGPQLIHIFEFFRRNGYFSRIRSGRGRATIFLSKLRPPRDIFSEESESIFFFSDFFETYHFFCNQHYYFSFLEKTAWY